MKLRMVEEQRLVLVISRAVELYPALPPSVV